MTSNLFSRFISEEAMNEYISTLPRSEWKAFLQYFGGYLCTLKLRFPWLFRFTDEEISSLISLKDITERELQKTDSLDETNNERTRNSS